MALDTYLTMSYTLQDRFGTKATWMIPMLVDGTALDLAALQAQWLDTGTDLDGVSDAKIVGGRIALDYVPDLAWKASSGSESFVERTCNIQFQCAGSKYLFGSAVPSWSNEWIINGKPDFTAPTPFDFQDHIVSDASSTQRFCNTNKQLIYNRMSAELSIRKKRKQLDRSSFEV